MKAILRDRYGGPDVLRFEERECPEPVAGELLVRMRASSLNRGDRYVQEGIPLPFRLMTGLFRPKQRGLGMDFAGDIARIGAGVTGFSEGEAVYGEVDLGRTWAEYAVVPADLAAPKPENLSYEEAAAVPLAALTALHGLRDASKLEPGQRVLLNGSTGAVGSFAVQIAKALGAEVTAVCSQRHVEVVRALGADRVIPYETASFLDCGETFDVLFDLVGQHSVWACRKVLQRTGTFTVAGGPEGRWLGPLPHLLASVLLGRLVSQRVASFVSTPNRPDLLQLSAWIEAGTLRPEVSRVFPFSETAEALRYLKVGHPAGKVVIAMARG